MPKTQPELDHTDRAILRALSADSDLTNKALASRLGLAESTCAYRVRTLRETGVIVGARLQLNLPALGFPIQAVIKVRLGSHGAEHVNSLYDELVRIPGVLHAVHVAGADDFHLHVAVDSPEALRDLVLKHITVHSVVRQTETHLVFEARNGAGVLAAPPRGETRGETR